MLSTDPYSKAHDTTLYSSGYEFVERKCNVSQTFRIKHSVIYIRSGNLMARGNVRGPKDQQSTVTVSHDAPAANVLSQHLLEKSAPLVTIFQGQSA